MAVLAKYPYLFRNSGVSGSVISQATADAWRNEPESVKIKFRYQAEKERAQHMSVAYQFQKRKADTMTTSSATETRADGKKSKTARKRKPKADEAKRKRAKAARVGRTTTGEGSGTTEFGFGSERAILRAGHPSSSLNLGFSFLSSTAQASSSRLGSVSEGTVAGQGQTAPQRPPSSALFPSVLSGTNIEYEYPEGGSGVEERSLNNRSTTLDTVEVDFSSAAVARQRINSEGGGGVFIFEAGTRRAGGSSQSVGNNDVSDPYRGNNNGNHGPGAFTSMMMMGREGSSLLPFPARRPITSPQPHMNPGFSMFPLTSADPHAVNSATPFPRTTSSMSKRSFDSSTSSASAPSLSSSSSSQIRAGDGAPPAAAPAVDAFLDGDAFAKIQILEDGGAQDDATMFHLRDHSQHSHDHFHFRGEGECSEGEGEVIDGNNYGHDQSEEDAAALREDQVPINKGKSRQSGHHKKK
ncbi:hypothetical protein BGZ96_000559 [Linnemannia gamsii]|uniref:HMG box domain-containing protein n=1 Tax=Linnemannia gamsii TaxID=64522 RepID=A0ABQ7KBP5_9FUNG|nr:hypothetical protein BGZ96_000559 [Linnemannia gamsii]